MSILSLPDLNLMTFTFKKLPRETGLAGVANPYPGTDIKHNRKIVGLIVPPNWQRDKWEVRLMQEKDGKWKWIHVKQKFDTEPDAREWVKSHTEFLATLNLHHMEPD